MATDAVPHWEYLIRAATADDLAALGREGWEVVSVVAPGDPPTWCCKRPAPSFRERVTLDQKRRVYAERGLTASERER